MDAGGLGKPEQPPCIAFKAERAVREFTVGQVTAPYIESVRVQIGNDNALNEGADGRVLVDCQRLRDGRAKA